MCVREFVSDTISQRNSTPVATVAAVSVRDFQESPLCTYMDGPDRVIDGKITKEDREDRCKVNNFLRETNHLRRLSAKRTRVVAVIVVRSLL